MASSPKESPPAILIVDDDLGFLVWLGLTLSAGGFVTVPATTGPQAEQLLADLAIRINLAIVNLTLPRTAELAGLLKRRNPLVKVIAIQTASAGPALSIKTDGVHSRSRLGWITLVRKVLGIEKATGAR
ncbi:MAG TPA: response regulator [Bryobacteraceae bacterium]|nr:response regulator [Bryobacteraceae bacterium]